MAPPPEAMMAGIWYLSPKKTPLRLMPMVSFQRSTDTSASFCVPPSTPALFTAKCKPPKVATVLPTASATSLALETSPTKTSTWPPVLRNAAAVSSKMPARRPMRATLAPRAASSPAVAAPIPVPAPVMKAVRPENSFDSVIGVSSLVGDSTQGQILPNRQIGREARPRGDHAT